MFDATLRDAQSTAVEEISDQLFNLDEYSDYSKGFDERIQKFMKADSGVLVYRRFRVAEAYGYECKDRELSLRLQLGALRQSMEYQADIPNFLEPWYGIGIGAAAFGSQYIWNKGQAPAIKPQFEDVPQALSYDPKSIASTKIGQEQLDYIEFFLEKTKGKLPMSFADVQSPLNVISEIVSVNNLFVDMISEPEDYMILAERVTELCSEFIKKQYELIGNALVLPGHGFASANSFRSLGASSDTSIMISNDMFSELEAPMLNKLCAPYGGIAYHSCGNWGKKIPNVISMKGIVCADGAFSSQTDPDPNNEEMFSKGFANSGVILNARVVGDADVVEESVKKLWRPGMKLIVNTYCKTPEQQKQAYERIHEICAD